MQRLTQFFFLLTTQLKVYHFNTKSYSRHVSSGNLFDKIILKMDNFLEVYQGRYGKSDVYVKVEAGSMSDDTMTMFLKDAVHFLENIVDDGLIKPGDTELLNIRDDVISDINQTLYLFTFK